MKRATVILGTLLLLVAIAQAGQVTGQDDSWATILNGGGPDTLGYVWKDSDDPGGPIYNWVDISSIGTEITTWTGNPNSGYKNAISLGGMTFNYYGANYTTIAVATNGFAAFTSLYNNSLTNYPIPHTSDPTRVLAIHWDNWMIAGSIGHVYTYYDAGQNRFIISWVNYGYLYSGTTTPADPHSYQIILNGNDSSIVFQYGPGNYHATSTVGMGYNYLHGLQVAYKETYLTGNRAIKFFRASSPAHDVALTTILSPKRITFKDTTYAVSCKVHNFGLSDETNVQVHVVIKDSTGSVRYDNSHTIPLILAPPLNGDSTVTFPDWTPGEANIHTITANTILTGDLDHSNDTCRVYTNTQVHHGTGGTVDGWSYADNFSGGPAYDWVDISSYNDTIHFSSTNDANSGFVDMGMTFNFFGTNYTQIAICTNGWLSFMDNSITQYNNTPMPFSFAPNGFIALLWDDLMVRAAAANPKLHKHYDSVNNRFIVTYQNFEFYPSGGGDTIQMQVILSEDQIKMQYKKFVALADTDVTIGIENQDGTLALPYNNCGEVLQRPFEGLAITYTHVTQNHDMAASEFLGLNPTGLINQPIIPQVRFTNNGNLAETNVPVRVKITPGSYNNLQHIPSIASGNTADISFATFTPASSAIYTVTATAELGTDANRINDTLGVTYTAYDTTLDFEANDAVLSHTGDWEWGVPGEWPHGPGNAHSGTKCWATHLTTDPTLNFTSDLDIPMQIDGAGAALDFYQYYDGSSNSSYYFRIMVDTGYGFNTVEQWNGNNNYRWSFKKIDLSDYDGTITVRLEMHSNSESGYDGWYVDDFAYLACHPFYPPDVAVTSMSLPGGPFMMNGFYSISATVRNEGVIPASFNVQATDGHGYSNTQAVSNLGPLDSVGVTFPGWNPQLACTNYTLTVTSQYPGDQNISNNTQSGVYFVCNQAAIAQQYDDGVPSAYWSFYTTPDDIIAMQFGLPYLGAKISAVSYKFTNWDDFGNLPDSIRDPVRVFLFGDADHDGMPDATPILEDTLMTTRTGPTVWAISCDTNLTFTNQTIWAGWSLLGSGFREAIVTDATMDYPQKKWARRDGVWEIYDNTVYGEPFIRLYVDADPVTAPDIQLGTLQINGNTPRYGIDTVATTVDNVGFGCNLDYTVKVLQHLNRVLDVNPDPRDVPIIDSKDGATSKIKVMTVQKENGKSETVQDPPTTLAMGGPDTYGYTWVDSDEPTGPLYDWVDISTLGTEIIDWPHSGFDGGYTDPLPMGMNFNFYGIDYGDIVISSNGWASFAPQVSPYMTNYQIPTESNPNALLAVEWDDMSIGFSSHCYYYYDVVLNRFIISWVDWNYYGEPSDPHNFQVILNGDDGSIMYQYGVGLFHASSTIGIENADGTDGLQIAYNEQYIIGTLAVKITPPVFWLSTDLFDGSLPYADPAVPFNVFMSAAELDSGVYNGAIEITSNDPDEPVTLVNVIFAVGAGPAHQPHILPSALSFYDSLAPGAITRDTFFIENTGTAQLNYAFTDDRPWITVAPTGGNVPVSLRDTIVVTLDATGLPSGNYSGNIALSSNDPDQAHINLPVSMVVTGSGGCHYAIGDANNSGTWTGQDVTYGVRFFKGGPNPPYSCECTPGHTWYVAGDVNGSCSFTGQDVTRMVLHFKSGVVGIPCPDCQPTVGILKDASPAKAPLVRPNSTNLK